MATYFGNRPDPNNQVHTRQIDDVIGQTRNNTRELEQLWTSGQLSEDDYIQRLQTGTGGAGAPFQGGNPIINGKQVSSFNANPGLGTGFTADGVNYAPPGSQPNSQNQLPQLSPDSATQAVDTTQQSPQLNITRNLKPGSKGADVKQLQQWLISQGFNIPQGATGFYGPQTKAAVAAWQKQAGFDTKGNPGYFGPLSRQYIQQQGQQQSGSSQGSNVSTGGTGTAGGGTNSTEGGNTSVTDSNTSQNDLMTQVSNYFQTLLSQGYSLNPNVQITPEKAAEFLAQAHSSIDPYYSNQLQLARSSLLQSAGYSTQDILAKEQQYSRDYGTSFGNLASSEADKGFAQSGERQKAESNLAQDFNYNIQSGRRALEQSSSNAANTFAQNYGGANLPSANIQNAPVAQAGQSSVATDSTQRPLYQLSDQVYRGLTGSQQYQQKADIASKVGQLESDYRLQQGTPQPRQIPL